MRHQGPPKLFHRFFRWFCNPTFISTIEGDLLERYHERVEVLGRKKADRKFAVDVLSLFRPAIMRRFPLNLNVSNLSMHKNHFKTAWRNLLKNKAFSAINIAGLSLGLTCSILIGLWVNDELNVDRFHDDIERIYVVTSVEYSGTEVDGSYGTPGLLGEELPKVFPEVEFSANYGWTSFHTIALGDKKLRLPGNFAGEDFFRIFSYPLIAGSEKDLLKSPESIVISRKMANTFFGSPEAAVDKTLRFETYKDVKITGVFEDIGDNSSDHFDYLLTWKFMIERNSWLKEWGNSGPTTFVKLRDHADSKTLETKMRGMLKKYSEDYTDLERLDLGLQPFSERYLHSNFKNGKISGGRIEYVNLFRIVAIFLIVIACINFMNLSTARSVKRAKEIGVRKAVGAMRTMLMGLFGMEALLFTLISVAIALSLLTLILPQFNLLTEKHIASPLMSMMFWIGIGIVTLLTALLSGSYPAIVLSSFKPATVLKSGTMKGTSSSAALRKGLVVFQFALSMVFIIGMIVVSGQVSFIQNTNLGYAKENLIYMPLTGNMVSNFEGFKMELLQQSAVTEISKISSRPVDIGNSTGAVEWEGKDPFLRPTFTTAEIGYDFVETMHSKMILGRDFAKSFNDSTNFIVNETALKVLGYKDPIGKPLTLGQIKGTIVGVIKDFHFKSLHVPIRPLILGLGEDVMYGWVLARVDATKMPEGIAALEKVQSKFSPDVPFTHQFADEEYGLLYQREELVKQLSRYFAGLAIFISSLGLLGLVIFTAEQRTKEVSIRKVLGANVLQIITLLSKDFLRLVAIAALLSFPIGYLLMKDWLGGFQYHIEMKWWMFVVSGLGAIVIAMVTVLFQTFRAAVTNPVDSLKSE